MYYPTGEAPPMVAAYNPCLQIRTDRENCRQQGDMQQTRARPLITIRRTINICLIHTQWMLSHLCEPVNVHSVVPLHAVHVVDGSKRMVALCCLRRLGLTVDLSKEGLWVTSTHCSIRGQHVQAACARTEFTWNPQAGVRERTTSVCDETIWSEFMLSK